MFSNYIDMFLVRSAYIYNDDATSHGTPEVQQHF